MPEIYQMSQLHIEITNLCNSRCIFCPHGLELVKRRKEVMPNDLFFHIIDICKREGIKDIRFGGLGEFLIDPDLFVKARYIIDNGLTFRGLTTNGMLLTNEIAVKLFEVGLKRLVVSIDSTDKTRYESIRRCLDFDTVMNNIWNLFLVSERFGNTMEINFNIAVMDDDHETRKKFIDKFKLIPNKNFSMLFIPIHNWGDFEHKNIDNALRQPCSRLFKCSGPIARVDGTLSICCMDYNNECSLGKIEDSILNLFNSDKMNYYRSKHLNRQWNDIPICKNCVDNIVNRLQPELVNFF